MLLALGILLWLVVTIDIVGTTVSIAGQGRVSRALSLLVWKAVCRGLLRSFPSLATALSGPLVLAAVIGYWVAATWLAWTLIFLSAESAVVDAASEAPAGTVQRLAYAGSKLSTLGSGLAQAGNPTWDAVSILPAVNGMILLSLTASYALSLVGITTRARTLAVRLNGLSQGGNPTRQVDMLKQLDADFLRSAIDLNAYPLASYFSPRDPAAHLPSAVLLLSALMPATTSIATPSYLRELWCGLEALVGERIGSLRQREHLQDAVEAWYRRYSLMPLPDWWSVPKGAAQQRRIGTA